MHYKLSLGVVAAIGLLAVGGKPVYSAESVQTSLERHCKRVKELDFGETLRCKGLGGYDLLYTTGNERESMGILFNGSESSLNYVPDKGFYSLDKTIIWRTREKKNPYSPYALIALMEADTKSNPQLLVARLRPEKSCLVKIINLADRKEALLLAEKTADSSADMPCLPAQLSK